MTALLQVLQPPTLFGQLNTLNSTIQGYLNYPEAISQQKIEAFEEELQTIKPGILSPLLKSEYGKAIRGVDGMKLQLSLKQDAQWAATLMEDTIE